MTGSDRRHPGILVIDIGGTHVKALATGRTQEIKIPPGSKMTPAKMVAALKTATAGWNFALVSIGYPGPVVHGRPGARTLPPLAGPNKTFR